MKKSLWLLLLLLLFPASVNALLMVNLPNSSVVVVENQPANYSFSFTNTFNFPIYNVTFSSIPEFSFPFISSLGINQSVNMSFGVLSSGAYEKDVSSLITFDYITKQGTLPKNVSVIVSDTQVNPVTAQLFQGDTILFTSSNESKDYAIFQKDNLWSFTLTKLGVVARTFTNVGIEEYRVQLDDNTTMAGFVNVSAGQVDTLTHNSVYDERVNFHLKSQHNYSSLTANFLTTTYSMNYTEQRNGAIFLVSEGQPVYNIHLSASPDWVSFDNNDLPVITDNGVVTYKMRPRITSVNETNKNYTISIFITSNNAPQINGSLSVYVNNESWVDATYAELPSSITMVTESQLKTFCKLFPTACPHQNITEYIYTNITTNETLEIRALQGLVERLYHKFDSVETTLANLQSQVSGNQQAISVMQTSVDDMTLQLQKNDRSKLILTWFFVILIILAILGVGGYFGFKYLRQIQTRRNLT